MKCYFRAKCFDSFESSSGPSRNRSRFCQCLRCILGSRTLKSSLRDAPSILCLRHFDSV